MGVLDVMQANMVKTVENAAADIQGVDETTKASFVDTLKEALATTNDDQVISDQLFQTMITDPDSVEAHDVTIAMAKAEMTLGITKAVIDKAVSAYKEITSLR